jgi:hypothetical protein
MWGLYPMPLMKIRKARVKSSFHFACGLHANKCTCKLLVYKGNSSKWLMGPIWTISLATKKILHIQAQAYETTITFKCQFPDVNSSKQSKAPILTFNLIGHIGFFFKPRHMPILQTLYMCVHIFYTTNTTLVCMQKGLKIEGETSYTGVFSQVWVD